MNGIKSRVFRGQEGTDFSTDYGDYGSDDDDILQLETTTAAAEPATNPGHKRARRESGREFKNPYDSEAEKLNAAYNVLKGYWE